MTETPHTEQSGSLWGGMRDPLVGKVVRLPNGEAALVLAIEDEYDDGTTLRYLSGRDAGSLTCRDTFAIRRYPIIADWPRPRRRT